MLHIVSSFVSCKYSISITSYMVECLVGHICLKFVHSQELNLSFSAILSAATETVSAASGTGRVRRWWPSGRPTTTVASLSSGIRMKQAKLRLPDGTDSSNIGTRRKARRIVLTVLQNLLPPENIILI
jgi:hypothetical protein